MKVTCKSSYDENEYVIDTDKEYLLKKDYHTIGGKRDEEHFVVQAKLMKYNDSEGYGVSCHYGWVFVVKEIIKKHFNHPIPDGEYYIGTLPDYCKDVMVI